MSYDRPPIKAPRLSGFPLRALASVAGSGIGGPVRRQMLAQAGVPRLMATACAAPALPPVRQVAATALPRGEVPTPYAQAEAAAGPARGTGFRFETLADYAAAYREGGADPVAVAEAALAATRDTESTDRPLRVFIAQDADDVRRQAEASSARFAEGKPLSVLDGVPIAVKDEVDAVPYPTTVGTKIFGDRPAAADAETVARLRAAGAVILGKTNMHEIGIGVTGLNPHHGVCRNPYDPARHTGGSSSGPAAAVAAGLGPVALGADGGGSIRMPASLCGVYGIKPTYGRVTEHGAAPLCWSVGHLGPIGATAADVAATYAILAGPDDKDTNTAGQPPVHLEGLDEGLAGVRFGVYRPWFEDADPDVVEVCDAMLAALVDAGAEVREVDLPGLAAARIAHLVVIASEMVASQHPTWPKRRGDYGLDVQVNLALASEFTSTQYVHAQRHRYAATEMLTATLQGVDAIITPATGCAAPPIPEDVLPAGDTNLPLLDKIMRFAPLANLTGHPAVSFPAGYTSDGLPVGMQAMGRHWEDHLLLRIAAASEALLERRKPAVWHSLLGRA